MLNLGSINNLAPRTAEDMKSSTKDFSLSSDKVQKNTAPNSSSSQSDKTLGKKSEKSEFAKKFEKASEAKKTETSNNTKSNEDSKVTYSNKKPSSNDGKVNEYSKGQVEVKDENVKGERVEAYAKDYSDIVPMYPQNQFFAPQAPIPEPTVPVLESAEEKILNQIDVSKVSPQNQPVVKFMKDLFQQLGIAPQKLLKAFETMPTEALIQSPQMAMEKLFQQLELQPGQYTKAQVLFTQMIDGLNKQTQNLEYKQVQIKPTIVDLAKKQDKNMEALGATPVMASASPLQNMGPQAQGAIQPQMQVAQKPVKTTLEQMLQERLMQSNSMNVMQAPTADFIAPTELGVEAATSQQPLFDAAFLKSLADANVEMTQSSEGVEGAKTAEDIQKSLNELMSAVEGSKEKDASQNSDKNEDLSKFFNVQDQKGLNSKMDNQPQIVLTVEPKAEKFNKENVQQILTKAEAMAKQGGGEMKIALRPDGLGEIHLKIQVKEGKVGLQMITESQDAKKLIEGSLGDLKMALNDHKLNLQDIKVDVSQKTAQDMLQQDARREEAREFLGQFRQFNEGFRNSSGDTGHMVRQYRSGSKPTGSNVDPVDTKSKKSNSNRRLDLVA